MLERFADDDVARLRIALARISRQLDRQSRDSELTRTQASVLATLHRCGKLRITELAEHEGLNPTMLSRVVAALERSGLLQRSPHPEDGRACLVALTSAGTELNARYRAERTHLLTQWLAALPGRHAGDLLAALPALESLAERMRPEPAQTKPEQTKPEQIKPERSGTSR